MASRPPAHETETELIENLPIGGSEFKENSPLAEGNFSAQPKDIFAELALRSRFVKSIQERAAA